MGNFRPFTDWQLGTWSWKKTSIRPALLTDEKWSPGRVTWRSAWGSRLPRASKSEQIRHLARRYPFLDSPLHQPSLWSLTPWSHAAILLTLWFPSKSGFISKLLLHLHPATLAGCLQFSHQLVLSSSSMSRDTVSQKSNSRMSFQILWSQKDYNQRAWNLTPPLFILVK